MKTKMHANYLQRWIETKPGSGRESVRYFGTVSADEGELSWRWKCQHKHRSPEGAEGCARRKMNTIIGATLIMKEFSA